MTAEPADDLERTELHALVDHLPDQELLPALRYLAFLLAEWEDSTVTKEDEKAIREGWAEYRAGNSLTLQEVIDQLDSD